MKSSFIKHCLDSMSMGIPTGTYTHKMRIPGILVGEITVSTIHHVTTPRWVLVVKEIYSPVNFQTLGGSMGAFAHFCKMS